MRQPHERISGSNVISSELAIHGFNQSALKKFRQTNQQVFSPFRRPLLAVLIGGSDENITFTNDMFHMLGRDMQEVAKKFNGTLVITTTRRTGIIGTEILSSYLGNNPKILFNDKRFSEPNLIGAADAFIVTADSLSMVSEALATDKPRILYSFSHVLDRHPLNPLFQNLAEQGQVTYFPNGLERLSKQSPVNELPQLGQRIYGQLYLPKNLI